MADLFGFFPSM